MQEADPVTGKRPLDCATCDFDDVTKASMHCGWMREDEWIGEHGEYPPIAGYNGKCCPGRLMSLSLIREAEVGVGAFRNGQLREYFPDQEAAVLQAVMELHGAFNVYESEQMSPGKKGKR